MDYCNSIVRDHQKLTCLYSRRHAFMIARWHWVAIEAFLQKKLCKIREATMKAIRFQKLTMRLGNVFILLCLLIINMNPVQIAQAAAGDTVRVSVASHGTP